MVIAETRTNLWQVLAGRGPEHPLPADADVWTAVRDRLNPAKARPRLRAGVEFVEQTSLRHGPYVMVRSPGEPESAYARLTPEEAALARCMDGVLTVAQLVGEFARRTGRLAPEQVQRVVADLAGGRMLEELPVDAFVPLRRLGTGPWPARAGKAILRGLSGRRMVIANPDRAAGMAYRLGGRVLFTRIGVAAMAAVTLVGLAVFARTWFAGSQSAFLFQDSYLLGALLLLGLNALGLLFHEAGHALGAKHAGRRVPAAGFLCYFGIPSAFVDTTDMWMADRRSRLVASAAGPGFALTFAGVAQIIGLLYPPFALIGFKIAFGWYLNTLFNLNPLMALDGYYLFMDWLEAPGLRPKAIAFIVAAVKRPGILWQRRTGEARLVAYYAAGALLWLVVMFGMLYGVFRQRYASMGLALWGTGWAARGLMLAFAFLLLSPLVYALGRLAARLPRRLVARWRRRDREADFRFRIEELRATRLGSLPGAVLSELAWEATWLEPRRGSVVVKARAAVPGVIAVANGALEARRPGDPTGHVRERAGAGGLVGVAPALDGSPSALEWTAVGTRLLVIPTALFARLVDPLVRTAAPTDQAEVEALLGDAPALAGLTEEARLALAARMQPLDVEPGRRFRVKEGYAALVGSGTVALAGGSEARRGDLIGPPSGDPIEAEARTRARLWSVAAVGGLGPFLGAAAERQTELVAHVSPAAGAHGEPVPAPLAMPWGGPPPDAEAAEEVDDRLSRGFRRLLVALMALALLALAFARAPGDAWAEIPGDTAVLEVLEGEVVVVVDGDEETLHEGDEIVVAGGDSIRVGVRSLANLELRGGAEALLCPTTEIDVERLRSFDVDPIQVGGAFDQHAGKVIAASSPDNPDFHPAELAITLIVDPGDPLAAPPQPPYTPVVENDGDAVFATSLVLVEVEHGDVTLDGAPLPSGGPRPTCGQGVAGDPVSRDAPDGGTPLTLPTTTTVVVEPTTTTTTTTTTPTTPTTSPHRPRPGGSGGGSTTTTTATLSSTTSTGPATTTTTRPPASTSSSSSSTSSTTSSTSPPTTSTTCPHDPFTGGTRPC